MTDLATLTRLSQYYTSTTSSEQHGKNGKIKFSPGRTNIAIEDVPEEYKEFANATTEGTLDLADFQRELAKLTIGKDLTAASQDELASIELLRSLLGFPKSDPENVTLSFTLVPSENGPLAVTRIQPQNYDANLAPIFFPTGLHHSVAVYLDFLQKLAINTGRQIIAFDSPGVGASVPTTSVNHKILLSSLKIVISKTVGPNQPIVVMGHSLSTIAVKGLLYSKDVDGDTSGLSNPVEKYICIAPVPWGKDEHKGMVFAKDYMFDGVVSMFTKADHLVAKKSDAVNYYFPLHDDADREWLKDSTTTQSFPIGPFAFLSALALIGKHSLWDQMDNPKVAVVLADEDQIIKLKKPEAWQAQGAVILENADHSAIAGQDVNAEWVQQIAGVLQP